MSDDTEPTPALTPMTEDEYRNAWYDLKTDLAIIDRDHSVNGVVAESRAYLRAQSNTLLQHNLRIYRRLGLIVDMPVEIEMIEIEIAESDLYPPTVEPEPPSTEGDEPNVAGTPLS